MVALSLLFLLVGGVIESCSNRGTLAMPEASSKLKGDNYQDVQAQLRAAGLTSWRRLRYPTWCSDGSIRMAKSKR